MSLRPLLFRLVKTGGRSHGRITSHHRGGGSSRHYRLVGFNHPSLLPFPLYPFRVERDPTRSAPLLLVGWSSGFLGYVLKPVGLGVGSVVGFLPAGFLPKPGCSFPIRNFPTGSSVYSVGWAVRSAGCSARLLRHSNRFSLLRLPSGELRLLPSTTVGSYGVVDNPRHRFRSLQKAGQSRWLGIRPTTRGVAMNPVDHPHGGGQGKTSGGRPSVSPTGRPTKGGRTRPRRAPSSRYILSRRKSK